jgi:hypothetical protein
MRIRSTATKLGEGGHTFHQRWTGLSAKLLRALESVREHDPRKALEGARMANEQRP